MAKPANVTGADFEFVKTPAYPKPDFDKLEDCGVPTTRFPAIKNAPLPADGSGADTFNNYVLISILTIVPWYMSWKVGGGFKTTIFFALIVDLPLLAVWWLVISSISPRKTEKVRLPGRPVEFYLDFKKESDRLKYRGHNKIPMETFHEMYFDGEVDFKGDCLEVMEYRHDWASFRFTIGLIKFFLFGMIPEVIITLVLRTRSRSVTTMTAVMTSTVGSLALA
jgi:hypothetical protein